jgi:signal transduction histidine kinase/ligand-binding sensor domain-containing protein
MRVMRNAHGRQGVVARCTVLTCALLMWCPRALALNPALDISQYAHTAWKIRDGFTKGTISSIAQTSDGYLWLGTEFGLLRFDGVRNVPWQPPPTEPLPSTVIMSLLAARDGALWIGTDKGLASWKGGKLTQYPELAGHYIFKLLEDREGLVWASGAAVPTGKLCAFQRGSVQCYGEDGRFGFGVFSLYQDQNGSLWAGASSGLWRLKPGPPKLYPTPEDLNPIYGLVEGDDGTLLLGTRSGIRRLVDAKTEAYPLPGPARQINARTLLRDRDGGLWVATTNQGLVHIHDGRTDVFAQSNGLSGDVVTTAFEDREGNIWVATEDGLDRFRNSAVSTLSVNQGLWTASVGSILAAGDGSVWLGSSGGSGGLYRWDNGRITAYRARGARPMTGVREVVGSGLPHDWVQSLFQDTRGRMVVSTAGGIGYFENDRFVAIGGVPGGVVRSIAEDHLGSLWIANQQLGLFHVLPGSMVQQIPWARLGRKDFATTLVADRLQGGLWLGFFLGGITYFADDQIRASYAVADGLGEGSVNSFHLEQDGTLWAATEGGLSRLKDGRVATLTSKDGLPCDAARWVVEDDARSFWLLMACGLLRIARPELDAWAASVDRDKNATRTIQATVFDSSDGVRSRALPSGFVPQVGKSQDGKLWFLRVDGVSVVDPNHLPFNNLPPPVHIEQITADRKTYDGASDAVHLPPLIRDLQIDYTALSLVAPEKMQFRYKLEGYDRDWQDVGTRRQAFYNDLPPKNYRFHVMARNNSGVWNETGAALDFSIAPAYYQTAWFRTLAVAMFLSLLWSAHRIRLRVIERHQAEITALNESLMKAQEQERTRIAGELHDGVMQQISALSLMLGTARRKIQSDLEAKAEIRGVQKKLIQVGTEVRQLSHDLHPSSLKDRGLPEALSAYCREFGRVRSASVSCDADDSVGELSRGAALALYRIAQEAMGNAVTHGAAQHVDVRLTRSNGLVALMVSDDGKGFDSNRASASGGLGLINMRERARQLNGTFELDSGPGRGTTVRVTIPFRPAV